MRAGRFLTVMLCAVLLCACTAEPAVPATEPVTDRVVSTDAFDYAAARQAFAARPLRVQTAIRCVIDGQSAEAGYTVIRSEAGYTATVQGTDQVIDSADDPAGFFSRVCYLAPYDTVLSASEQGYIAKPDLTAIRPLLLSASTLFSGYAEKDGVRVTDCTYTVTEKDGGIGAYAYDFTLAVEDAGVSFTADVTLTVTVME